MRMDRRAGLLKRPLPSLAEVFADMTEVSAGYNNGKTSSSVPMNYPKNVTLYYFKVASNAFLIGKVYNDSFTWLNGSVGTFPTLSEYSSTQDRATSTLKGGVVMLVSIANYEEAVVDAVFSAIQETTIYGQSFSESDVLRVAASDVAASGIYITAFGRASSYISISSSDDLYTPIFSYTGNSSYEDRVYLYKSGNYVYFSQTGADTSTTLNGARLSLLT